jgi:beta-lactamase regulating signal transducer with metallopeptidase domain
MNGVWVDVWAAAMGRACWQGGLALLVVWGACAVLRRTAPAVKCWLWRLGYLKFLVALFLLVPISVPLLPAPRVRPASETSAGAPLAEAPVTRAIPAPAAPFTGLPAATTTPPVLAQTPAVAQPGALPPTNSPSQRPSIHTILFVLWLLGVVLTGVRVCRAWHRTGALRRAATPIADPGVHALLARLAAQVHLRRPPQLLTASQRTGPLLAGVVHPAILLPSALLAAPASEPLRLALTHELGHLRRRDIVWNLLQTVVDVLFFFHPLIYLARRQSRYWQELACDHLTLATSQASPADYGRALLDILALHRTPAPAFAGVGIADSVNTLRRRLLAMKSFRLATSRRVTFAAVLVSLLAVAGILPWRLVAQSTPPVATSTAPAAHGGKLDFRIAVLPEETGENWQAVENVSGKGPASLVKVHGVLARWFEIHPSSQDHLTHGTLIADGGKTFMLCYDDHDHTLTHADPARHPWSISASNPMNDRNGISLPFKLDAVGAGYLADLTAANKSHPLAILLDDRVISAPTIQSQIRDAGIITFGTPTATHTAAAIQNEAYQIKDAINGINRPATGPASTTAPAAGSAAADHGFGAALHDYRSTTAPAAGSAPAVVPAKELTLKGLHEDSRQAFADLDTGRVVPLPDDVDFKNHAAVMAWARKTGVDLVADTSQEGRCLLTYDTTVARLTDADWDTATQEKLGKAIMAEQFNAWRFHDPPDSQSVIDLKTVVTNRNPSRTWAFLTHAGSLGMLQVLEYTDEPRGSIKFQYRIVANLPPAQTAPATGPAPTAAATTQTAARRAKELADHADTYQLILRQNGANPVGGSMSFGGDLTTLVFSAPSAPKVVNFEPGGMNVRIPAKQAQPLIDHLQSSGLLARAYDLREWSWIPPAAEPGYTLQIGWYYLDLGWGSRLVRELEGLQKVLDMAPAKVELEGLQGQSFQKSPAEVMGSLVSRVKSYAPKNATEW